MKRTIILAVFYMAALQSYGQLTDADREEILQLTGTALKEQYISAEKGKEMDEFLMARMEAGVYQSITDPESFVRRITEDLRGISGDLHLSVFYSPEELPELNGFETVPGEHEKAQMKLQLEQENYGLQKVEILPGNIGYMDFTFFAPLEFAGDTYARAFKQLEKVDALVIDLRNNRGSMSDQTIPFICGYLFRSSVHLNSIYFKKKDFTRQYWSSEYVPSGKLSDIPVYLLTSSRTFSGGEELAYDLKVLKRATLIGHTTAGGANPVAPVKIHPNYGINLPQALVINPVTGTNWEGTGVQPDVEVLPIESLDVAVSLALKDLIESAGPQESMDLRKVLDARMGLKEPLIEHTFVLEGYSDAKVVNVPGSFNYWSLKANRMVKSPQGWTLTMKLPRGTYEYKFLVDGQWLTDAKSKQVNDTEGNQNSVIYLN